MSLALPTNSDPFASPDRTPTSSDAGDHSQSSFVPPPLPPRPTPAGRRKPVPSYPNNGSLDEPVPRGAAPALPPRPQSYALAADAPTYTGGNVDDFSRLPPPPTSMNEKGGAYSSTGRKRWWYPSSSRGRKWWWGILVALLIAIGVVIAVCVTVIPKKSSSGSSDTTSSGDNNGGHPLSIAEGGVDIGKPGSIAKFGNKSTDHFVMTTRRSIAVTRLDPIINPNSVSSHVHRIHGSSYFTANLTTATDMQSLAKCTTTVVQDDKSAYWVAQLYYRYPNGSMVSLPIDRTSLYYFQKAPTGVPIYPFPDNYNIVAGNPMRRSINYTDPNRSALWWQCYRGAANPDSKNYGFPSTDCAGGLVQAVQFPSCWDGVYAEDADYSSHVVYPTDGTNGHKCPKDFPKKFITIQFETVFATYKFPFNGAGQITWVLANGDTSGYGIHGDFMNGWKPDVLQDVLDNCRYMNATKAVPGMDAPANCPALAKSIDMDVTNNCRLQTSIINEPVGEQTPLQYLPGCNGLWEGNATRPGCPPDHIEGGDLELVQPSVWFNNEPYVS
ncbi:hypothetical protein IAU60_001100 [Kwoniella sp. DSM 27419]